MSDRLAIVLATEHPDVPAPHADTDALAFSAALIALGFAKETQIVLTGTAATRTAIESRLRKLVKAAPAPLSLFVFFAGHGFSEDGEDYLVCADTQADDRAETSLRLKTLLDALTGCKPQALALFLDVRSSMGGDTLSHEQLAKFFANRKGSACFVSTSEGEESHVSLAQKSGIWAHHVVEALTGKAPLAIGEHNQITAQSLQDHLAREVPRTLRSSFHEAPEQTPTAYLAAGGLVLANVGTILPQGEPTADPRLQPLRRASLRNESAVKVKTLGGFRKFHKVPDRVNDYARRMVADLAADDIKEDIDQVYSAVRELLGYKRRDVESSSDRGTGFVRTPDFEYAISIDLNEEDPTTAIWRREVANIRNPEVVLSKPFQSVFGAKFDTLSFEFTKPFDLEGWVDRIEEETPAGVKLKCASDCSVCDVSVKGFVGVIRLFRDRVEVRGEAKPGSGGLVEAFLRFQDLFAGRRDLDELPLLESK